MIHRTRILAASAAVTALLPAVVTAAPASAEPVTEIKGTDVPDTRMNVTNRDHAALEVSLYADEDDQHGDPIGWRLRRSVDGGEWEDLDYVPHDNAATRSWEAVTDTDVTINVPVTYEATAVYEDDFGLFHYPAAPAELTQVPADRVGPDVDVTFTWVEADRYHKDVTATITASDADSDVVAMAGYRQDNFVGIRDDVATFEEVATGSNEQVWQITWRTRYGFDHLISVQVTDNWGNHTNAFADLWRFSPYAPDIDGFDVVENRDADGTLTSVDATLAWSVGAWRYGSLSIGGPDGLDRCYWVATRDSEGGIPPVRDAKTCNLLPYDNTVVQFDVWLQAHHQVTEHVFEVEVGDAYAPELTQPALSVTHLQGNTAAVRLDTTVTDKSAGTLDVIWFVDGAAAGTSQTSWDADGGPVAASIDVPYRSEVSAVVTATDAVGHTTEIISATVPVER